MMSVAKWLLALRLKRSSKAKFPLINNLSEKDLTFWPSRHIIFGMIKETFSENETFELGRTLGLSAKPGDIYCLDGDLGAGKTVFAKGFAAGLGIDEPVTSPTFTIVKEYPLGRLPLYHFDVYRIADPDEMYAIGYEDYFFGNGVCLVEWSELIEELIPESAVHITITRELANGTDYRKIAIETGT